MMPYSVETFLRHYQLSLFLTSCSSLSLGLFILTKNPRHQVNRLFAIFMLCVAVWSFTQALIGTWPHPKDWLLIAKIEHLGHVFIPSIFLQFVHVLIRLSQPKRMQLSYAISLMFFCTIPTPYLLRGIDETALAKFALEPGPLYPIYVVWFVGTIIEALMKLHGAIGVRVVGSAERLKLKYIFWSTFIGFTGGLPNFLYVFDINWYPVIPFCTYLVPIFPAVMAYAIVRHRMLDINVAIRRSLVYSLLVGIITAVYFTFVLIAEKTLQGVVGYRSLAGSLVAGFTIALGFNPLKESIQRFIDQLFFHGSQVALAEENEKLRHELSQSEKLRAVSTLAAGMAHEIKNPLASIKTFAEYLPQRYEDPAFREKFSKIISQEVDKMNTMIQRLLEFARPAQPHLQSVRVSTLVRETLDFLHGSLLQKQIQVEEQVAQADEILADPSQMKQVLLNLFLNSIEAMDHPGQITVSTFRNNGHLELEIADTGRGIAKADLPHIFDPFYTTKVKGTGLGLSVVHSIVREHGGRVAIESEPGQGTTVRMSLPLNGGADGQDAHSHCG